MTATRTIGSISGRIARLTGNSGTLRAALGAGPAVLLQVLRDRIWSDEVALGVRLDLRGPIEPPAARIDFHMRPLVEADLDRVFSLPTQKPSTHERRDQASRRRIWSAGIKTGYAAATDDNEPCYIQWLMTSSENDAIQRHFHGRFPVLRHDEALLEGAYTSPSHRGKGIMAAAQLKLAQMAEGLGMHSLLIFTPADNVASLKATRRGGFVPYAERRSKWRFLRHSVTFRSLPPDTPYPHELLQTGSNTTS